MPAKSKRSKRNNEKSRLGLWCILAVGLLLCAYIAVLEFSRPHV